MDLPYDNSEQRIREKGIAWNAFAIPLLPFAAEANNDLLSRLTDIFGIAMNGTDVKSSSSLYSLAALSYADDGLNILINRQLSFFKCENNYSRAFAALNPGSSQRDFFISVLSHQYGIKLFREYFIQTISGYSQMHKANKFALEEGFSFYLSDSITGLSSPMNFIMAKYKANNHDTDKIMQVYNKLQRIGNEKAIDPRSLGDLI